MTFSRALPPLSLVGLNFIWNDVGAVGDVATLPDFSGDLNSISWPPGEFT